MAPASKIVQLVPILVLGALFVFFVAWFVRRLLIQRKPIPPGVANASRTHLMDLMDADKQAALEHQMYMEEDESRPAEDGDPPDPHDPAAPEGGERG